MHVSLSDKSINTEMLIKQHDAAFRYFGGMPEECFYDQAEQSHMLPYLTPSCLSSHAGDAVITRKADKTGLIAWQSNKYSVPMNYQRARVGVICTEGQLLISDLATGEVIAQHLIRIEKGQVIKNRDHYRDKAPRIETLEADIMHCLGQSESSEALCALLKATSPKIYKDQLLEVQQILTTHCKQYGAIEPELLSQLINTSRLTATGLRDRLTAFQQNPARSSDTQAQQNTAHQVNLGNGALAHYGVLNGQPGGQGEIHVIH
jgi:hypothetical protein